MVLLRTFSWLYTQGLFLAGLEPGLAVYKARDLPTILQPSKPSFVRSLTECLGVPTVVAEAEKEQSFLGLLNCQQIHLAMLQCCTVGRAVQSIMPVGSVKVALVMIQGLGDPHK